MRRIFGLFGLAILAGGAASAAVVTCDVAVVGGGSAGFAAALAAAENGADVVLVEKEEALGGTLTVGGVNCWEPVCGATGTPQRVYERLRQIPQAAGVYGIKHHCCWPEDGRPCTFPGAWCTTDPALGYDSTLRERKGQVCIQGGIEGSELNAANLSRFRTFAQA